MLGICAYYKYKVKIVWRDCIRTGFDEFEKTTYRKQKTIDGCRLIEEFATLLKTEDLYEFTVVGNKYYFGRFRPTTGETFDTTYTILEAKV